MCLINLLTRVAGIKHQFQPRTMRLCQHRFHQGLFGQDHAINHMNHTIAGHNVSFDNIGVVHHHLAVFHHDLDRRALHGFRRLELDHVTRHHVARYDVIKQDFGQLYFVSEQCFDRARRQFGKGFVGWRKHRERPFALQRFDQASRFQCGRQRFEAARCHRSVNDVFLFVLTRCARRQRRNSQRNDSNQQ